MNNGKSLDGGDLLFGEQTCVNGDGTRKREGDRKELSAEIGAPEV